MTGSTSERIKNCPLRFKCDARRFRKARRGAARLRRLLVCSFVLLTCLPAPSQISPGPLAKPHQALTGDTNCIQCHQVSTRAPSFKCIDCHREIADELQRYAGLHATFPRSGPPGAACVKCHSDHNGVGFQMIHWDPTPQGFNHAATGFALDGKHTGVSCRNCHNIRHIAAPARALLTGKDLNHTWMGLSPNCATCHEDAHQGRFGSDCARCHNTNDWKAATVDKTGFDHSKTHFPLYWRTPHRKVRELSHARSRWPDSLCGPALRQLFRLSPRLTQWSIQTGMRFLPHHV